MEQINTIKLYIAEENIENIEKAIWNLTFIIKNAESKEITNMVLVFSEVEIVANLLKISQSSNGTLIWSLSEFFNDVLCSKSNCDVSSKRVLFRVLHERNAAEIFLKALKRQSQNAIACNQSAFVSCLRIIAKLSSKDDKFALKCRLLGALKILNDWLVEFSKNNAVLPSLLTILKNVAKNPSNQVILGKEGCISTLMTILNSVPRSHSIKIKLILDNLNIMTKIKSNVIRATRESGLNRAISFLETHEKLDKKYQVKIVRSTLNFLSHLADSKHGRRVLHRLEIEEVTHRFISSINTSNAAFEVLIDIALNLFLKCACKETSLPIKSARHSIRFEFSARVQSSRNNALKNDSVEISDHELSDEYSSDSENDVTSNERKFDDVSMRSECKSDDVSMRTECKSDEVTMRNECKSDEVKNECKFEDGREEKLDDVTNSCHTSSKTIDVHFYDNGNERQITEKYNPKTATKEHLNAAKVFFSEFLNKNMEEYVQKDLKNTKKNFNNTNDSLSSESQISHSPVAESSDSLCAELSDSMCAESSESLWAESYLDTTSYETHSLFPFVKIAYPDWIGAGGAQFGEPLHENNFRTIKDKALRTIDRIRQATNYKETVLYDFDNLTDSSRSPRHSIRQNFDEQKLDKKLSPANHLIFESRFESGNLRKAIQIAPYEYDLFLNPDVNSEHHHQWFYFEVTNMTNHAPYVFNIVNNEKNESEFNSGMKPVMFSVKEAKLGRPFWRRVGTNICYHKNYFLRNPKNACSTRTVMNHSGCGSQNFSETRRRTDRESGMYSHDLSKYYYTVSFTVTFLHSNDVVYFAYHYPYTYTRLQTFLRCFETSQTQTSKDVYFKNEVLCSTLRHNPVPIITITDKETNNEEKEIIFLTSRVHPGESNSSWIMESIISLLMTSSVEAQILRRKYVFKIVPMLNPEGVIHGNQRCGLTDEDLNRKWRNPHPVLHPTIYWTKTVMEYCTKILNKRIFLFCDFHGHSRQKNVFLYGCSNMKSWWRPDSDIPDDQKLAILPQIMARHMKTFSVKDCRYNVEKARESTARIAVWRQFKVALSYTLEASACGCNVGPYKGFHLTPKLLKETGESFCTSLLHFADVRSSLSNSADVRSNFSDFADVQSNISNDVPSNSADHQSNLSDTLNNSSNV